MFIEENPMESTEIQLFSDTFDVNQLTSQETRENLYLSINQLDVNKLSDLEIRQSFNGIRVALGVFIRKFVELEGEIKDIKFSQIAYEAKMERLFLKSRSEIQELKQELNQMKSADKQMEKVVQVAKLLKDNNYAPVAIKSMMKGITSESLLPAQSLPDDFEERLDWATKNGFRWNKNNRAPSKMKKQVELLESWEMEFHKARGLEAELLLSKDYVIKIGKGGPPGALLAIESILGYQLEERKTLSVFNCYQKAIKLLEDKLTNERYTTQVITTTTNFSSLVFDLFGDIDRYTYEKIVSGLNRLPTPYTEKSLLAQIKIYFSVDLIPRFINLEDITNPLTLLPKLQGNTYDKDLLEIINKNLKEQ